MVEKESRGRKWEVDEVGIERKREIEHYQLLSNGVMPVGRQWRHKCDVVLSGDERNHMDWRQPPSPLSLDAVLGIGCLHI